MDSGLGIVQAAFTVAGFAGTLVLLGPWMAVTVLLAAVPALLAELAFSRRRAEMVTRTGQATRWEVFYSDLLTNGQVVKELRLYGAGPYLWRWMAGEIRTIQTASRRINRREGPSRAGSRSSAPSWPAACFCGRRALPRRAC
ncbi:hypothetical protein ACBJ59_54310 [Nonomuraea sp. MTCD27]|uniref:hypothetical protein n=1 Tax=Nonomuraea sp. MTCD27 TaxID=1676747 RepID=UPI0035C19907